MDVAECIDWFVRRRRNRFAQVEDADDQAELGLYGQPNAGIDLSRRIAGTGLLRLTALAGAVPVSFRPSVLLDEATMVSVTWPATLA